MTAQTSVQGGLVTHFWPAATVTLVPNLHKQLRHFYTSYSAIRAEVCLILQVLKEDVHVVMITNT